MGTWLQEAIEEYSYPYEVKKTVFDVNAWRLLCSGFLKYIEEHDLTAPSFDNDEDNYIFASLDRIETFCSNFISIVQFLRSISPPSAYHYGILDKQGVCKEFIGALNTEKQRVYESFWLDQNKKED